MLAGYPVVDVKVTLHFGSYHDVDSNENAFKQAGSMAFKEGMRKASPVLLEPMMAVEVETPEKYVRFSEPITNTSTTPIAASSDGTRIRSEVPTKNNKEKIMAPKIILVFTRLLANLARILARLMPRLLAAVSLR